MEIKLNGYNLNDTSVKTNEIQFDTAPPIEVQQLDIAGSDGSKFVASRYGTKIIKILGYITAASQSALETALDTFKQSILDQENIELNISYAGGYRQFIGNVSSFIWTKRHHNITFQPFEIEFTVGDPPFAYSVSTIDSDPIYEEAFSAKDFTGNSLSHTLTFEGTAKPKAKWTYLLNTISGQTSQLVFKSKTTGKQMEINAAFTPGDQIEIDQEDYSVRLNNFDQDYEGVFPEFERGANEFEWQVYGIATGQSGVVSDQSCIISSGYTHWSGGFYVAQIIKSGLSGNLNSVEFSMKKRVPTTTNTITCSVWDLSSGTPNSILGEVTINQNTVLNDFSWIKFDFSSSGISFTSGTSYAISLYSAQRWDVYIKDNDKNIYSDGQVYYKYLSYPWTAFTAGYDVNFKTYIDLGSNEFNHTSSLKVEYKRLYL